MKVRIPTLAAALAIGLLGGAGVSYAGSNTMSAGMDVMPAGDDPSGEEAFQPATTRGAGEVMAITPFRVYDSREGHGRLHSGKQVVLDVWKDTSGDQQIPRDAKGVYYNLTVVNGDGSGFVTVRPGDAEEPPTTSTVNFAGGTIVANGSMVALPKDDDFLGTTAGQIAIDLGGPGSADFIIDITGYIE